MNPVEDENIEKKNLIVPLFSELSEQEKAEYWATLALRHCAGIGARLHARLNKYFGSSLQAFQNVEDWGACRIPSACREAIKKEGWRKNARKEWDAAKNIRILLWINPLYPQLLRDIPDAPALLYIRGKTSLLGAPCVALVGSRRASNDGKNIASKLAASLSSCGLTVVSGMAVGIDCSAHCGAIANLGSSIGVLGTGINKVYPVENTNLFLKMGKEGLLVSEFSPDMNPQPANFPVRNRIISGLSLGTVVVEAAEKSGSLITAQLACEQNREVFAIPDAVFSARSKGCQNLIRQGAHPVFSHEDILRELMPALRSFDFKNCELPGQEESEGSVSAIQVNCGQNPVLSSCHRAATDVEISSGVINTELPEPDQTLLDVVEASSNDNSAQMILECLKDKPLDAEALAQKTGLEIGALNSELVMLELKGEICRLAGAIFKICG